MCNGQEHPGTAHKKGIIVDAFFKLKRNN